MEFGGEEEEEEEVNDCFCVDYKVHAIAKQP